MGEDFLIEQKFGRKMPFKVPQGYFEQLEKAVMDNIAKASSAPNATTRRRLLPLRWAACIAVIMAGVAAYFYGGKGVGSQQNIAAIAEDKAQQPHYDYTIEEVSDFVMLDNDDIYSYLSGE